MRTMYASNYITYAEYRRCAEKMAQQIAAERRSRERKPESKSVFVSYRTPAHIDNDYG